MLSLLLLLWQSLTFNWQLWYLKKRNVKHLIAWYSNCDTVNEFLIEFYLSTIFYLLNVMLFLVDIILLWVNCPFLKGGVSYANHTKVVCCFTSFIQPDIVLMSPGEGDKGLISTLFWPKQSIVGLTNFGFIIVSTVVHWEESLEIYVPLNITQVSLKMGETATWILIGNAKRHQLWPLNAASWLVGHLLFCYWPFSASEDHSERNKQQHILTSSLCQLFPV